MRRLTLIVLLSFAPAAAAQLRTIPKEAEVGVMRHLAERAVELNGKEAQLSLGAQIRDADNRLVLPASLNERQDVKYQLDRAGLVHRVWVLSPREKAALPPPPFPK